MKDRLGRGVIETKKYEQSTGINSMRSTTRDVGVEIQLQLASKIPVQVHPRLHRR